MVGGVLVTAAAASPKSYWPEGNYPDPDSDPYPEEKAFYGIMLTLGIAGLLLGILAAILSCGCFSAVISCKCCFESLTEQVSLRLKHARLILISFKVLLA